MYFADCHTHSLCSPDSETPMLHMGKRAWELGLNTLCLTDHCDLLTLEGEPVGDYDWAAVEKERLGLLAAYGSRLDLPLGLELGMAHLDTGAADKILGHPGLDFVIGSCHNLSPEAGGRDFFLLSYETLEQCYQALDNYFDSMLQMAAGPHYDVVGHIIYPLRYMKGSYDAPPSLARYREQIREIMGRAIQSGRGIEINTWKAQTLQEWVPVLKDYKELGGEILTVGSDAHAPGPLAKGVREAYAMLEDLGFRYVAVYHGRKPDMMKLK